VRDWLADPSRVESPRCRAPAGHRHRDRGAVVCSTLVLPSSTAASPIRDALPLAPRASVSVFLAWAVLVIGREWLEGFTSLATFPRPVSAGVAIALKDPLANLAGWAFIIWSRPSKWAIASKSPNTRRRHRRALFQFTLNKSAAGWTPIRARTHRPHPQPAGLHQIARQLRQGLQVTSGMKCPWF